MSVALCDSFQRAVDLFQSSDEPFSAMLQNMSNDCKAILDSAAAYDLSESLQYNGFRSFVKIIHIYINRLIALATKTPNTRRRRTLKEFTDIAPLFLKIIQMLKLVMQRKHGVETSDFASPDSIDLKLYQIMMQIDENDVRPVFAMNEKNFWLCASLRRVLYIYLTTMLVNTYGISKLCRPARKIEYFVQFYLNTSTGDLRRVWSAGEQFWNRALIKVTAFPRGSVSTVRVHRQSRWIIPAAGPVESSPHTPSPHGQKVDRKNSVKMMVVHYGRRGRSPRDSLIFHCHGGGFIALSPKSHEGITRRWSRKLKVPVVSIDYRLAPEYRYPCALQDVLDAYLFLTSGSPQVVDKIGFHPKNIVICGDSAGGQLAVALVYVLNDIRKQERDVLMPVGISVQFPVANPVQACFSASRVLSIIDCFLGVGPGNVCSAAYSNHGPEEDLEISIAKGQKPWYRESGTQDNVLMMQNKLTEPYFNLLSGKTDELQDICLFIQACEFDPLLDDSIQLGRHWKGPVHIDVIENVMHGFLSFQDISCESRQGGDLCIQRISQALKLDIIDQNTGHEGADEEE